jgi:hypothetical protein
MNTCAEDMYEWKGEILGDEKIDKTQGEVSENV